MHMQKGPKMTIAQAAERLRELREAAALRGSDLWRVGEQCESCPGTVPGRFAGVEAPRRSADASTGFLKASSLIIVSAVLL
jgi:hypothetical protein